MPLEDLIYEKNMPCLCTFKLKLSSSTLNISHLDKLNYKKLLLCSLHWFSPEYESRWHLLPLQDSFSAKKRV
jgi:hypothetical protein